MAVAFVWFEQTVTNQKIPVRWYFASRTL